jgi:2-dehydropantoate 2-reductase
MKIAVIGAGGVGGYFGGRLAAAGNDVTFVARGAHLKAMREKGLQILSALGDVHIQPVSVAENIHEVESADLVLISVKLWDLESLAGSLSHLVGRGATILSLQNGIQKDDILRKSLPSASIVGGACYIQSVIAEPGVIRHSGMLQRLVFGEYDGKQSTRLNVFLEAAMQAGIDAEISNDIQRVLWQKFIFLVGLSGTTTSIRQPIGPILKNSQTRSFLLDVVREVVNVGRASGISLPENFADQQMGVFDGLPETMTSSMHHDLQQGNRLELPWLSGAVAALGESHGIPSPCNRAISDILAIYSSGTR